MSSLAICMYVTFRCIVFYTSCGKTDRQTAVKTLPSRLNYDNKLEPQMLSRLERSSHITMSFETATNLILG